MSKNQKKRGVTILVSSKKQQQRDGLQMIILQAKRFQYLRNTFIFPVTSSLVSPSGFLESEETKNNHFHDCFK